MVTIKIKFRWWVKFAVPTIVFLALPLIPFMDDEQIEDFSYAMGELIAKYGVKIWAD